MTLQVASDAAGRRSLRAREFVQEAGLRKASRGRAGGTALATRDLTARGPGRAAPRPRAWQGWTRVPRGTRWKRGGEPLVRRRGTEAAGRQADRRHGASESRTPAEEQRRIAGRQPGQDRRDHRGGAAPSSSPRSIACPPSTSRRSSPIRRASSCCRPTSRLKFMALPLSRSGPPPDRGDGEPDEHLRARRHQVHHRLRGRAASSRPRPRSRSALDKRLRLGRHHGRRDEGHGGRPRGRRGRRGGAPSPSLVAWPRKRRSSSSSTRSSRTRCARAPRTSTSSPTRSTLRVRFRIDGTLHEMMAPPFKFKAAIISRLKIMAELDIAERRVPQDGRIKIKVLNRTHRPARVARCRRSSARRS